MSNRSTRNKLRWQMTMVLNDLEKIMNHFKLLDDLADDRSPYIRAYLPLLVQGFEKLKESCITFREGL